MVICFEGGYHGRTLLTLSLTSKYGLFKSGFGPFAPEIVRLPIPHLYRTPEGMTEDEYVDFGIRQLEHAFVAQVDPSAVAAVIIETVQGEAGFVPVPPRFLKRIRELCTKHGIVMIADEVQCGMGRTGRSSPSNTTTSSPTSSSAPSRSARACRSARSPGVPRSWTPRIAGGVGGTVRRQPGRVCGGDRSGRDHPAVRNFWRTRGTSAT